MAIVKMDLPPKGGCTRGYLQQFQPSQLGVETDRPDRVVRVLTLF